MALDELPVVKDPLEERLRRRVRAVFLWTDLVLIVVLALADTFGGKEDIHASPAVFGGLLASFLIVSGASAGNTVLGILLGNGKH